jgi:hypothetical protein
LASVKAPFSWPNSSASSRLAGIDAQLNSMNGPLRAAVEMQGAGHQFLAGAGFAFDQHRRQVVAGHAPFGIEHLAQGVLELEHDGRLADQRLQTGLLRLALLVERQRALHALGGQGLVQHQLELGQHHRLGEVVEGALLHACTASSTLP